MKDNLSINTLASNRCFLIQERFPKWRQHFLKKLLTIFLSRSSKFRIFPTVQFCSIFLRPNTYKILYEETLGFQCKRQ